jgi:hypothetical protein
VPYKIILHSIFYKSTCFGHSTFSGSLPLKILPRRAIDSRHQSHSSLHAGMSLLLVKNRPNWGIVLRAEPCNCSCFWPVHAAPVLGPPLELYIYMPSLCVPAVIGDSLIGVGLQCCRNQHGELVHFLAN